MCMGTGPTATESAVREDGFVSLFHQALPLCEMTLSIVFGGPEKGDED